MPNDPDYNLVAGSKPWNLRVYNEVISHYPGDWEFVSSQAGLAAAVAARLPRRIFFLHWSWIVPEAVLGACECVCFHMTDVPYGRGGSPLQNLIVRGHEHTRLTALQMTNELDAGPVYDKRDLGLHGTAEEVYIRASYLCAEMIRSIVENDPAPVAQSGEVVQFGRRKPTESEIPELPSLAAVHDFIRMLDAVGYPHAFIRAHGLRFEFRRAALYDQRIEASVVITREPSL